MSEIKTETQTQHAMLVVWGQFAQATGLIDGLNGVHLHQKKVQHAPQTKILEFFVMNLAGLPHLQDVSVAAEPIEKDAAVAQAWQQLAWADYSGVSRSLTTLTQEEAEEIVGLMDKISQPYIDREVMLSLSKPGYLVWDGDLTTQPVSDTSTTYQDAAYGYMDKDRLGQGYQVAKVSIQSNTYGRLMLSSTLHPGDVVSCTQTQSLVLAAEAKTGMRPWRRTNLLTKRLEARVKDREDRRQHHQETYQALEQTQAQIPEVWQQIQNCQEQLETAEREYQQEGKEERPFSKPGKLRRQLEVLQRQKTRLETKLAKVEDQLGFRRKRLTESMEAERELRQCLEKYEQENAANSFPVQIVFRLDAGFGTPDNVAWLIEMGYEVYTRPYSNWLKPHLKRLAEGLTWTRVGKNAEMIDWKEMQLEDFPYSLDLALERFHIGSDLRHSAMLHFGSDPVTANPAGWFSFYNARQTIEAGIKEGKGTFAMHYLKVRSKPAIYLQEQFARFAANFVRWASEWLAEQCPQIPNGWEETVHPRVKQQVKVGAHTSAWVSWQEQGCLLRFTDHSVFAGRSLHIRKSVAIQLALPFAHKSSNLRF